MNAQERKGPSGRRGEGSPRHHRRRVSTPSPATREAPSPRRTSLPISTSRRCASTPKPPRTPIGTALCSPRATAPRGCTPRLANRGYFDVSELQKLRHIGAMLQGHPDMKGTPGVDMSSGSLGQGISAAVGMALGGQAGQQGVPRLHPAGRRRKRGGPGVGGRHVRRPPSSWTTCA